MHYFTQYCKMLCFNDKMYTAEIQRYKQESTVLRIYENTNKHELTNSRANQLRG
jgi:hypothetical protein